MAATFRYEISPGRTTWFLVFCEDNTWRWVEEADVGQLTVEYGRYELCADGVHLIRYGGEARPWKWRTRFYWQNGQDATLVSEDGRSVFNRVP
jgi:hypothetical protein